MEDTCLACGLAVPLWAETCTCRQREPAGGPRYTPTPDELVRQEYIASAIMRAVPPSDFRAGVIVTGC